MLVALTLMASGRAMTLAFIANAGGTSAGDPPIAWLMPLLGDAVVGVVSLPVAYLAWRGRGLFAWTAIVVWHAIAIWDALSAYVIHSTVPWPSFFMIEIFGASMFFMATAMHAICIYVACRREVRDALLTDV